MGGRLDFVDFEIDTSSSESAGWLKRAKGTERLGSTVSHVRHS